MEAAEVVGSFRNECVQVLGIEVERYLPPGAHQFLDVELCVLVVVPISLQLNSSSPTH
jgi:hypothetical protein